MNLTSKIIKRSFDLVCSTLGLLVMWPVIVVCAIVARSDTGGSGIFNQRRIGRNGQEFVVYKIRTMYSREFANSTTVTVANDARITRSGSFMRRYKLDELPQLFNVLLGQMSLVGPRPDVPGYADRLKGDDRRLLELRPGITGPATIKYRDEERLLSSQKDPEYYNQTYVYPDKIKLNLEYVDSYSIQNDVRFILITLGIMPVPDNLIAKGAVDQ